MVGDLHIRIAKLAFHAKESPIRTRDEVFNLVSSWSRSPAKGYSPAIRTPTNPGLPHLDHVDKLDFLAYHIFDTFLESVRGSEEGNPSPSSSSTIIYHQFHDAHRPA